MRARGIGAGRGVEFLVDQEEHHPAVRADRRLLDLLAEAVTAAGQVPCRLVSGAGHDAAVMASLAPMAMLFVRSPGGVSHHPDECILREDVGVTLDVLVRTLDLLADRVASAGGLAGESELDSPDNEG
jgi:allantoate deiminase